MHDSPCNPTDFASWLRQQSLAGANPDVLIELLIKAEWSEDDTVDSISEAIMQHARDLAIQAGMPVPVKVPSPFSLNGPSENEVDGQKVKILANLRFHRVVVLGNFLSPRNARS